MRFVAKRRDFHLHISEKSCNFACEKKVTSAKPYGNVTVEDGGELRIKANETILTKDVEVKLGGTLKISK